MKKVMNEPPDGTIRQSQVVTTFGPGAMVDLVDQAVLIGGLDFWGYGRGKATPAIQEPRLRDAICERFRVAKRSELSADQPFRKPPVGNDRETDRETGILVLEFPRWFICQNPKCRGLLGKHGLELKRGRYTHQCDGRGRAFECVPVRFLGACPRGHVQEWPWIAFAHLKVEKRCAAPSLKLEEGAIGDFSEVKVSCACGATQALSTASGRAVFPCDGQRPWLGSDGKEPCDEKLRLLVRTASNSYFSQEMSALSVPEPGRELDEAVQANWSVLKAATPETLPAFRTIPMIKTALEQWSDDEVLGAIRSRSTGATKARDALRTAEFKQFVASKPEQPGDLPPADAPFFARKVKVTKGTLPGISGIVLASKLREVRAQIGFTRLEPATPDLQGEFDLEIESAPLSLSKDWLPATEILGEGVFIQLDEGAVRAWEQRPEVKARARELTAGYDAWLSTLSQGARDKAPRFLGARFYLLHSLSHLLISAISLECGYSASAIRERLYCGPSDRDSTPMAAILLATGSSGTEGTLGGLVDQGRKLQEHLRRAYDLGKLCSNDPVCAAHSPDDDPAERYLEGAGCHGCLFIAECSCERFNRYLDRALVVPTVGHPRELAFFSTRP